MRPSQRFSLRQPPESKDVDLGQCSGMTPARAEDERNTALEVANETQTRTAVCPTHGKVEATREMPKPGWPYLVYAVRRLLASRRSYRCPTCSEAVTLD